MSIVNARRLAWIVVACACAVRADAGVKNDALKQLDKGSAAIVKQLATVLGGARGAVDLAIDAVAQKVKLGSVTTADIPALRSALEEMQVAVKDAVLDASDQMATVTKQAMATLESGGIVEADYPRGFRNGDGGPLDDFHLEVDEKMRKHYAKVRARLVDLEEALDEAGVCLCVRIDPPIAVRERTASATVLGFQDPDVPLTLDLLVAYADIGSPNGEVRISGTAHHGATLSVSRFTIGSSSATSVTAASNDRWAHSTTLGKHNHVFRVSTTDDASAAAGTIGLR